MSAYLETKLHGKTDFPFIVYYSVLPEEVNGFPMHWHEEMEIIYVVEGKISLTIQSNEYTVSKNEIALIPPQSIHAIRQVNQTHAIYFNILFRFSMLSGGSEILCQKKYLDPIYERNLIMPEYLDMFNPLRNELEPVIKNLTELNWPYGYKNELLIKARLLEIMHIIKNNCTNANDIKKNESEFFKKLKKSLLFIESNYSEHITVAQAADMSNFSESYFSKIFRQLTGSSFTQYIKDFRLERAAEKIRNTNTRISEIAFSVGFNNLSYFTRSFKAKYKMTPKAFQMNYKK